ncbi:MAG: histidine kinase [Candidatus Dormibacteraeota bacterium]|nr:histidine kinase [Candidatus Dormibacteraeota bacterium]
MDAPTVVLVGLLISILLAGVLYSAVSSGARRRRAGASLSAIDFARGSFASQLSHGVPMADLLVQLVEALGRTFQLDAAELWLLEGGRLALVASEPNKERPSIAVTAAEQSIAANARVSSVAWARMWLPELLDGRPDPSLRVAPITHSGTLFGLIVAERSRRGDRLASEADATLEEVAREVGVAVNKARLDSALQQSIEQLRRQAIELQASRGRLVAAADEERRRIERNLHDGAQQHLIAIAIKARLIEQLAGKDTDRANHLVGQLQQDTTAALDELRALAHGIYPPLLSSAGLGEALSAACRRASLPATVDVDGIARYAPEIESAVYFCCLEALQNAGKYAGEGASARGHVWGGDGELRFEVEDDGVGFDGSTSAGGAGLTNMRDRLGAVGGTIMVESALGKGARVRGVVPLHR